MFTIKILAEEFNLSAEHAALSAIGPSVGAIVSFTGQVRDTPLELEHYPAMAERELQALLASARARWPLIGATIIHRYGKLLVGDQIVLVLTASSHRQAAFEAAEYLMDWLKTKAPFWKKAPDGWVEAKSSDDEATARWEADGPTLKP